jgi:pyrroline-5-carboxylate reductase
VTIGLGIIGGGVMAEAILSRLLAREVYQAQEILISEPQAPRQKFLQDTYQVAVTSDNFLVAESEVLLLAIKPQVLDTVLQDLANLSSTPLVLSILAGTTLSRLQKGFPHSPIIRVMPNTPATVGAGITALAPGEGVTKEDLAIAHHIFASVGQVVEVSESLMDAVTGLSGSGPAFVAMIIEALADGGVAAGLPRPIASKLALQTVLGTSRLLAETDLHPAQLKDRVTSPGGTTIAGVAELEKAGLRSALIQAVLAAYRRSVELGQ